MGFGATGRGNIVVHSEYHGEEVFDTALESGGSEGTH